jgi:hypothetical protein
MTSLEIKEWIINSLKACDGMKFSDIRAKYKQEFGVEMTSGGCKNQLKQLKKYRFIDLVQCPNVKDNYWILIEKEKTYQEMLNSTPHYYPHKKDSNVDELPTGAVRFTVEKLHKMKSAYTPEKKVRRHTEPWIASSIAMMGGW